MSGGRPDVVDTLENELDGHLRAVGTFDRDGYEVWYVRDDVAEKIADTNIDRIHRDLLLQGIEKTHLEDLFDADDLRCTMHRFAELTAFHFLESDYEGLFVAIDSEASVDLQEFCRLCRGER